MLNFDLFGPQAMAPTTAPDLSVSSSSATSVADEAGFAQWFNLLSNGAPPSASDSSDVDKPEAQTAGEGALNALQQQFMDTMGLGSLGEDLPSMGEVDAGISNLQNRFLAILQHDLMQSAASAAVQPVKMAVPASEPNASLSSAPTTSSGFNKENEGTNNTVVDAQLTPATTGWHAVLDYAFGQNGPDINDGFDALNLINHIPVVADIYQQSSATQVSVVSDLAGSFLYGGPTGLAYSALDLTVEGITGRSITQNMWQLGYDLLFSGNAPASDEVNSALSGAISKSEKSISSRAYAFARRQFAAD